MFKERNLICQRPITGDKSKNGPGGSPPPLIEVKRSKAKPDSVLKQFSKERMALMNEVSTLPSLEVAKANPTGTIAFIRNVLFRMMKLSLEDKLSEADAQVLFKKLNIVLANLTFPTKLRQRELVDEVCPASS